MTTAEERAFNAGVAAVLDLARTASADLATARASRQPGVLSMQEALDALADKGGALLLSANAHGTR